MIRRVVNIVVAVTGLILTAPIIAILAVVIRLESKGSPIFLQRRVGRNENEFCCVKLRTMYKDTPDIGTHLVGVSRITRLGKVLRLSLIHI